MPLGPFLSPSLEDTGFPAQMEIYKALQGWMLGSKEGEAKTRDGETLVPFTAPVPRVRPIPPQSLQLWNNIVVNAQISWKLPSHGRPFWNFCPRGPGWVVG